VKTKTVTIPTIAADVLDRATVTNNVITLPAGQLDRPTYDAVNKVLTAMGGKWNKKAGGHLFAFDPTDMLAEALGIGKAVNRKKTLQFFETPEARAERMAKLAGVKAGDLTLEPSAGHGRLVMAMMKLCANVVAVEIDAINTGILSRRCSEFNLGVFEVNQGDFLEWALREKRRFDAVVMNPPFTGNQDIRHVMAAWGLLRDGGRLVAIVSDHGFMGREAECVEFRAWLHRIGATTEEVPAGEFAESGTNVAVRMIRAIKAPAA
jgi:predicted RNA methylase